MHPLGASAPVPTDVRIVTATHRDLATWWQRAAFAKTCCIESTSSKCECRRCGSDPTTWNRSSGICWTSTARSSESPGAPSLPEAMALFRRHTWPGNVREMENAIERALVLGTGRVINVEDLPDTLREQPASERLQRRAAARRHRTGTHPPHAPSRKRQQGRGGTSARPESKDALPEAHAASYPHRVARQARRFPLRCLPPPRLEPVARQPGNTCSR